jgi:hypothetical protein
VLTASASTGEAPWRAKLQAGLLLLIAVAGTVMGAVAVYMDYRNSADLRAYQSAGTCSVAADALSSDSCRYMGNATVTATSQQSKLSMTLTVEGLRGHSFVATFPFSREPAASYLADGATAPAELWNGTVTQFAGVKSAENPEFLPKLALAGWILVVVGLGLIGWGVTLARKAWRR